MLEITTTAEIQTHNGKAWAATQMMVATNFVQFLRALKMFGAKCVLNRHSTMTIYIYLCNGMSFNFMNYKSICTLYSASVSQRQCDNLRDPSPKNSASNLILGRNVVGPRSFDSEGPKIPPKTDLEGVKNCTHQEPGLVLAFGMC